MATRIIILCATSLSRGQAQRGVTALVNNHEISSMTSDFRTVALVMVLTVCTKSFDRHFDICTVTQHTYFSGGIICSKKREIKSGFQFHVGNFLRRVKRRMRLRFSANEYEGFISEQKP